MKSVGGLQLPKNLDNPVTAFVSEPGLMCPPLGTWTSVNLDLSLCLLNGGRVG